MDSLKKKPRAARKILQYYRLKCFKCLNRENRIFSEKSYLIMGEASTKSEKREKDERQSKNENTRLRRFFFRGQNWLISTPSDRNF